MKKIYRVQLTLSNNEVRTFGVHTTLKKLKKFLNKKILDIPFEKGIQIIYSKHIVHIYYEEIKTEDKNNIVKMGGINEVKIGRAHV